MRKSLLTTLIATTLTFTALPADADIVLGGFQFGQPLGHPLRVFDADAQGADLPIREISGADTQLDTPATGSYAAGEEVIYVSDYYGRAIRVYPAFAHGNVAPLRVLNPPLLGQPRRSVPLPQFGELAVIASNCCIYTWPLQASGDQAAPLRGISYGGNSGSPTELRNPTSLIHIPSSDELAVVDYSDGPSYDGRIIFHARTATGYVAPTRMITGSAVRDPRGLAHDPVGHRLFVLTIERESSGMTIKHGRILVFAEDASGDAQPLHVIEGAATHLDLPVGYYNSNLGFDPWLRRIVVTAGTDNDPANNRLLTFAADASGNVAPVQELVGSNVSPYTVGEPFAVPPDRLFANGFDP
ncbi:MAG: hypothetical protein KF903_10120 [Dokdonella sp.]|uniref:hypothetical protein n=1 Tax=Dokdonella sp. TaxID=2291710 RepID=UPI0025BBED6D|nr:hypothetical protein [Dokdonella sp.]MBX3701341.1 hypothetical protein [Dokdonella sp.]